MSGKRKVWDQKAGCYRTAILPGEIFVSDEYECVTTIIAQNIAVCLFDPEMEIGGMCNISNPYIDATRDLYYQRARFALFELKLMLDQLIKIGARNSSLEAKLFAPASKETGLDISNKAQFVIHYLEKKHIAIVNRSFSDVHARKLYYTPVNNVVESKKLLRKDSLEIIKQEQVYIRKADQLTTFVTN